MSDNSDSRKTQRKVYAPVDSSTSPLHVGNGYVDSRKGSGSTFLWIILALLVCGAMVGGYYFFLRGDDVPAAVVVEDSEENDGAGTSDEPAYTGRQVVSATSGNDEAKPVTSEAVPAVVESVSPVAASEPESSRQEIVVETPVEKESVSSSGGKGSAQEVDKKAGASSAGGNNAVHLLNDVDTRPEFPGGEVAMYRWLSQNIMYPAAAAEEGVQGRVIVSFVIEKDGSVSDVSILRGKHAALDREALRLVKGMPRWTPARKDGSPVRSSYTLPITFKLQ